MASRLSSLAPSETSQLSSITMMSERSTITMSPSRKTPSSPSKPMWSELPCGQMTAKPSFHNSTAIRLA